MNSLNLLSAKVIGQTTSTTRPRSRSQAEALTSKQSEDLLRGRSYSDDSIAKVKREADETEEAIKSEDTDEALNGLKQEQEQEEIDEKKPLIEKDIPHTPRWYNLRLKSLVKRIADAITTILKVLATPVIYIVKSFQDENGKFSAIMPFKRMRRKEVVQGGASRSTATAVGLSHAPENEKLKLEKPTGRPSQTVKLKHTYSTDSLRSTTSESESDRKHGKLTSASGRPSRQKSQDSPGEPRRQSIRIKLHNEDTGRRRKQRTVLPAEPSANTPTTPLTVDSIKSPTSPSTSLKVTRYPHAPQPPRPLTPRRQPSYANLVAHTHSHRHPSFGLQQKTLILDLDETLIHSLAKGNRMSTGHMVEVKLNAPVALSPPQTGAPPPTIIGPQHPILYYVHKRPHCEEFLRKVSKWYKLVVFTASVQEYADPVIDWLEQERKYFVGRYYRQHCTFRNGAYIKDLSSIEPDLSKVVILDNSPVSYIFHEDNAIPIEGWINDPTDNDLMHLIPMLEALQYATDVRALLALRRGEADVS